MNRPIVIDGRVALGVALSVALFALVNLVQGSQLPAPQQPAPAAQTAAEGIPAGAVLAFNLSTCPAGWSEVPEARGRYIVGLTTGGTLSQTVGTALTNGENRPVGQHTHTVTDPGHNHGVVDPGHGHTVVLNDPGHTHTAVDLGHTHTVPNIWLDSGGDDTLDGVTGKSLDSGSRTSNTGFANIVVSPATTGITATINSGFTGISLQSATTGLSVQNAGLVPGTNAPYLQLLICIKQ